MYLRFEWPPAIKWFRTVVNRSFIVCKLRFVDNGEDLDENDSGVEDASDLDSDVEECQIESLI